MTINDLVAIARSLARRFEKNADVRIVDALYSPRWDVWVFLYEVQNPGVGEKAADS